MEKYEHIKNNKKKLKAQLILFIFVGEFVKNQNIINILYYLIKTTEYINSIMMVKNFILII